jgi:hypothetical protein
MAETELDVLAPQAERRMHFDWLLPLFFRPGRTLSAAVKQERGVWLLPLLVVTLLIIISVLAAGPARVLAAQTGGTLPLDFQYWSPDQQAQYMQAQQNSASPLFISVFPALGAVLGLWVTWFLLGSILHLGLTLIGSRSSNTAALNLAGWASLPLGVRYLVQTAAVLASGLLVKNAGLSGFIAADAKGFDIFLRAVLALVDIYWIWQTILLMVGSAPMSGLKPAKSALATLLVAVLVLALAALPGFLGAQLSGLSGAGSFLPF